MSQLARPAATRPAAAMPSGQTLEGERERQDFQKAVRHFNVGDINGASRLLSTILEARPDEPDALHLLGVITAQRGAPEAGASLIARALKLRPEDAVLRNNLAGLLLTLGRAAEAAEVIVPALSTNANNPGLRYNYGNAQRQLGSLGAAIEAYRAALAANPGFLDASLNLVATLIDTADFAEAERVARAAVAQAPQSSPAKLSLGCALLAAGRAADALVPLDQAACSGLVDARHRLGRAFLALGRAEEARRTLERAALDAPGSAEIRNDLGVALLMLGTNADAVRRFREAIARASNNAEAHANLADALRRTNALPEAVAHGERATQLAPLMAAGWLNLGAALLDAARPREAHAALARALALNPNAAEAENSYGSALEALGDSAAALAAYDRALALNPDLHEARFNRALASLKLGDYRNGLADYEARRRLKGFPDYRSQAPEWRGEPLHCKTLLLYAEQGYGDTLQFARFASLVARGGLRVVLAVQAPLVGLLQGVTGVAAAISTLDPPPPHDLVAPLLSVPHKLGIELAMVPNAVPYVLPPKPMALEGAARKLKVGIAWAGSAANRINHRRSCPLEALAPLGEMEAVQLYGLQVGPEAAQLTSVPLGARAIDLSPRLADFRDTAAAIMALDLVVTIDTSVAHLAGALGRPVWVMLSAGGDWRYLEGRTDSPWYPTMRLFRQPEPGDWAAVIEAVRTALLERASTRSAAF